MQASVSLPLYVCASECLCVCMCVFALFLLHANNCAADSQSQRVGERARGGE